MDRRIATLWGWALLATAGPAAGQGGAAEPLPWVTPQVTAPRLQHRTFESAAVGGPVSYHLYLPEVYDTAPERRFPVLYWLHGSGGGLAGLRPLTSYFDTAIREGRIPPLLVVFPNGLPLSLWVNSKDGTMPVESMVIDDLLPHIDATWRTIPDRRHRLVEGFSMGGYGAARFALKYPELFGGASVLAGGPLQQYFDEAPRVTEDKRELVLRLVCSGDLEYFSELSPWVLAEQYAAEPHGRTPLRIVGGQRDVSLPNQRLFHKRLVALQIPHRYVEIPDVGHEAHGLLAGLGERNWSFYRLFDDE